VNVVHVKLAAILLGPTVPLVDHQPGVGVAAAHGSGAAVGGVRALAAGVMQMVGDGFDVVENVGVEMLSALPLVARALNHVPEMRNDAGLDETLAVLVEIDT